MLSINDFNIEEIIAYLTLTKDLELSINTIDFVIWNLNKLEYAINSEHFENRVRDINLTLNNFDFITDTIISNINAIKPNKLKIKFYGKIKDKSYYRKILSEIKCCPNIELNPKPRVVTFLFKYYLI